VFTDFASQGGKTPAQLWAEKHAKASGSTEAPRVAEPAREIEPEEEKTDISSLRNKFSGVGLEPRFVPSHEPEIEQEPEPEHEPEPERPSSSSFAAITSQFAAAKTPPLPTRDVEPVREPDTEAEQPSLPARTAIADAFAGGVPNPETAPEPVAAPVESGNVRTAIVSYDYDKDDDNEISLKEGEVVTDIEFVDADWWQGKNSAGEVGLFPSNYVELEELAPGLPTRPEVVHDEPALGLPSRQGAVQDEPSPNLPSRPAQDEPASEAAPSAVAEFDYEAAEEGELTFAEGDIITEIEFVDESWWSGTHNGVQGLFPSNYVVLQ
jgi:drebrin-like protein